MLTPERYASLDRFLLELNRAAAEVILPLFRAEHRLENKTPERGFDPVTAADRGAEDAIRKLVAERYPEHGVIGEEHGEDRPDAEFVWVIDPIDGTRAFIAGLPVWTTLIGLRFEGRPALGSIGQPYLGELFIGHPGGSRLVTANGERPLRVRPCSGVRDAIIATTDPDVYFDPRERTAWSTLRGAARVARTGCDAYAYAMVAAGHVDLVVEAGLRSWDVEAAIPVVVGAGGVFTDWSGAAVGPDGGHIAIAGDEACHAEAIRVLSTARAPADRLP